MNVLAVLNEKGGVAKTTTAVNLAFGLARPRLNHRVLLVDMDPQSNATTAAGFDPADYPADHIGEALLEYQPDLEPYIIPTAQDNLSIIPASRGLLTAKDELIAQGRPLERLEMALAPLQENFDYIIIDLPPTIEVLQELAIEAADHFIVPLELGRFALDGLGNLILKLTERKDKHGSWKFRILLSKVTGRTKNVNIFAMAELKELRDYVLDTQIRFSAKIPESQNQQQSIFDYARLSDSARDFRKLSKEITTLWPTKVKA